MPDIHAERRRRLAARLAADGLDAALLTRLVNVHYLTGLTSSNAAVLVTADGTATLATDGRYATAAATAAPDVELTVVRGVAAELTTRAASGGAVRLGVEAHDMTLELNASIQAGLDEAGATVELRHLGRVVEELRSVKDDTEIAALRTACEISSRALEELLDAGALSGRTEKSVARDLEWRMYDLGADAIAFETIVATGPHSAIPHHRPTDRVIARGDLLKIDFGAAYRGYHADCTRTCLVESEPADWQREIYDIVATAQRAGSAAVRAGGECLDVDTAARDVIAAAGYRDRFGHGTGHGVGLEVHEAPTLGYSATGRLADRMTVTVEPGIYLPDRGGVRIEDTLVVRDTGGPELLTPLTKDLLVVGA